MTQTEKERYRDICEMYSNFSKSELVRTAKESATDLFRVVRGKSNRETAIGFMATLYAVVSEADGMINDTELKFYCDTFLTTQGMTESLSGFREIVKSIEAGGVDVRACFYNELRNGNYDEFFYKWKVMIIAICIAACDGPINESELYWLTNFIPYQL